MWLCYRKELFIDVMTHNNKLLFLRNITTNTITMASLFTKVVCAALATLNMFVAIQALCQQEGDVCQPLTGLECCQPFTCVDERCTVV